MWTQKAKLELYNDMLNNTHMIGCFDRMLVLWYDMIDSSCTPRPSRDQSVASPITYLPSDLDKDVCLYACKRENLKRRGVL